MTTKEAFTQLISKRGWYKDLGIKEGTANSMVAYFKGTRAGRISEEKIEEVLQKAGYKVVQEKMWGK